MPGFSRAMTHVLHFSPSLWDLFGANTFIDHYQETICVHLVPRVFDLFHKDIKTCRLVFHSLLCRFQITHCKQSCETCGLLWGCISSSRKLSSLWTALWITLTIQEESVGNLISGVLWSWWRLCVVIFKDANSFQAFLLLWVISGFLTCSCHFFCLSSMMELHCS